jgi:hypothetical protein
MADLIQVNIDVNSNADQAAKGLDRLQGSVVNNLKAAERLERGYKTLDRAFNKGKISAQMYAKGMQQVDAAIEQAINGTQQATRSTNTFSNSMARAAGNMNQFGRTSVIGGKNLNRTNMMVQQAGYQFQDFAVQIQGGTNAFVALGQQGSQLLGVFGPAGAVLGAFLAVGTAIARAQTNGKELAVDFKGLGQDLASSLSHLKPLFDGIATAVSAVGSVVASFASFTVQNLDRVATYVLTAATAFGVNLVKGIVAARIATMTLAGSFVALRNALIRTGIGLLVVAVGELVFQFLRVMQAVGGFGQAMSALLNVSKEVLGYISDKFMQVLYSARAAWSGMLASGLQSLKGLAVGFTGGLEAISNIVLGTVGGIKAAFNVLPEFIGDIAKRAANLFIEGMESLANSGIAAVNKVIEGFNKLADFLGAEAVSDYFGIDLNVNPISDADLSGLKANLSSSGVSLGDAFNQGFTSSASGVQITQPILAEMDRVIANASSAQVAFEQLAQQYGGSFANATPALQALIAAIKNGSSSVVDLGKHFTLVEKEAKGGKKAVDEIRKEIERLNKTAAAGLTPFDKYNKAIAHLNMLRSRGLSFAAYSMEIERLNEELAKSLPMVNDVADAFGDFLARGLTDFKSFANSIFKSFQNMLAQMIATAARNKILISMGATGSIAGPASAASNLAQGAGMMGSVGTFASSIGTGLGVVGNGFMAGGLSGAATATAGAVSGGIGAGGAMGFGTALGAALPVLAAVAVAVALFRKKTKELDSGLNVTVKNMDALVTSFKTVETSRFFGLSKKTSTSTGGVSSGVSDPIVAAVQQIQQSVLTAAEAFGFGADAFDNFSYQFKLSLKGLSEEQQMQKINEELAKMGDSFASLTGHFSSMNELLEAAEHRFQIENRLLTLQGKEAEVVARNRERELAATHELNREMLQLVFTLEDAAQAAQAQAAIAEQQYQIENRMLEALGRSTEVVIRNRERELAATHALNRGLLQATFDLEDANAAVSAAMDGLRRAIDAEKDRLRSAFDGIVEAIRNSFELVIKDLRDKLSLANEAVGRSRSIFRQLESALSGRSVTSDIGQTFARREGALSFIRGGDFSDEKKLEEALGVVSEPTEGLFSSFIEYARDFARTSLTLEEAKNVAKVQLTADEQQVLLLEQQIVDADRNLEQQLANADSNLEQQLAALDQQYQVEVDQYNALLGIDTSVKSVGDAIATLRGATEALASAQAAAKAAQTSGGGFGGGSIDQFSTGKKYQGFDLLDVGGAAGLLQAAGLTGVSTSGKTGLQIAQDIANATGQAVQLDAASQVQQFARGGMFDGGMRLVGEEGPELEVTGPSRIYSKQQTKELLRGGDSNEGEGLRAEVSEMRQELRQLLIANNKYTKRSYDLYNKWDIDGLPAERT